jgi:hypothetical protein
MLRKILGSHKCPNGVTGCLYCNKGTAPPERKMREDLVFIVLID